MKCSKFVALVLIFALLFSFVNVTPARADVADLDKDDDGDIDLLDASLEVIELGMFIYDWWTEPSTSQTEPEPKKEESSSWWPF